MIAGMMRTYRSLAGRPVRLAIVQFLLFAAIALVVLSVGWSVVLRRTSENEAIVDARNETRLLAEGVLQPNITGDVLRGAQIAIDTLDDVVRKSVLPTGVKRVKIWRGDGTVIYSDEPRLMGTRQNLDEGKAKALRTGQPAASVTDLEEDENRYEPRTEPLIEVYHPIRATDGTPLLVEAYFSSSKIREGRNRVFREFVPVLLGAVLTLTLFIGPLLWSTVRMLKRSQDAQEALLQRALASSDMERRRIARDLHDGVVQDLAGVSLAIAGVLDRLPEDDEYKARGPLSEAASSTRLGIRQLRTLLVDLVPPELRKTGLEPALSDLLSPLQSDRVTTSLSVQEGIDLPSAELSLVYRTAQEAIRNVRRHANATRVDVTVTSTGDAVELCVADNGLGFDPTVRGEGHLGLELLRAAADDHRAHFEVSSTEASGTVLRLIVPFDHGGSPSYVLSSRAGTARPMG